LREVLLELMPKVESIDRSEWLDSIDKLKGDSAVPTSRICPTAGIVYAAACDQTISGIRRATATHRCHRRRPAPDVGGAILQARASPHAHHFRRIGHDGFRFARAIGAKVACPEAEVWVIVGDGGFQMTMCELATMVQENLKINIAIINNGFLGMVRQWQGFSTTATTRPRRCSIRILRNWRRLMAFAA